MTRRLPASSCTSISRQPRVAGRAGHQADVRRALEDLLAFLLRHASQHAEDLALAGLALELLQAVEDLLLGLVADAAGVVEHQVRPLPASPPASSPGPAACRRPSRSRARSSGSRRFRGRRFSQTLSFHCKLFRYGTVGRRRDPREPPSSLGSSRCTRSCTVTFLGVNPAREARSPSPAARRRTSCPGRRYAARPCRLLPAPGAAGSSAPRDWAARSAPPGPSPVRRSAV